MVISNELLLKSNLPISVWVAGCYSNIVIAAVAEASGEAIHWKQHKFDGPHLNVNAVAMKSVIMLCDFAGCRYSSIVVIAAVAGPLVGYSLE